MISVLCLLQKGSFRKYSNSRPTNETYKFKPAKHLVLTSAYLHLPSPAKSEDKGLVTLQEGPLNPGRQKHSPGIRHEPWHSAEHMATKQMAIQKSRIAELDKLLDIAPIYNSSRIDEIIDLYKDQEVKYTSIL